MKKLITLVTLIIASAIVSFAQSERIGTRQWKLVSVDGMTAGASTRAYLELNAEQTKFTGNAGCNRMFGSASVQGRRVDFSGVGTTRMACAEPRVRRLETAFVRALENVDRFRQRGNALELYDRNRLVVRLIAMTKQSPEDPEARVGLEDRKWVLAEIKGVPVSKLGRGAFLSFDANKKSAGGNSSCNVFGGSYTASAGTLGITDVVSTMRACVEDERMTIEREFLDGLRQANRYDIERGKLMLYRNQRLLLTFDGERK